jgi:hypothetical protein
MIAAKWLRRALAATLIAIPFVTAPGVVWAAVLYSNDFDDLIPGSVPVNASGLVQLHFNTASFGYSGAVATANWEVTATGGTGGSHGFTEHVNGQGTSDYDLSFGVGVQPGGASASQIRVSMDIMEVGGISTTPVKVDVSQIDFQYESERGVDANQDGDMDDPAITYQSISPSATLTDGVYAHISFTLDEGVHSASITKTVSHQPPIVFPLTPLFDPTRTASINVTLDAAGFGLDNGNSISVDNLLVESVPEPSTIALLVVGCAVALAARRR